MNVWVLVVILITAAVLGNMINYAVGTSLGAQLKRSNRYFIRNYLMNHLPEAEEFFDKYGGKAIILGRFFPVIRTYIPFVAGVVKMDKTVFVRNTLVGAFCWICLFLLTEYYVGEVPWVKNNYGVIFIGLILITLVPLVVALVKNKNINTGRSHRHPHSK